MESLDTDQRVGWSGDLKPETGGRRVVARYGGDEFVIVFVAPATHREQTLSRMKKALRTSFKQLGNDKQKTKVGAAVGISVYPYPSTSITMLLRHADEAMYAVKGIDTPPLAVGEYTT